MIQSLKWSTSKNIKVCFPLINRFLKDIPFCSIQVAITDDANFLSKLGCFQICSPTQYSMYFPVYKGFFMLVVSIVSLCSVSLWLLLVFSLLIFPSSFTRCMIKWRWHWVFFISRFRFILAFFNEKNFKWIPQWNSGILLMVQFDFLVFTGFFNCYKIFCVAVSFMNIYLLNW